MISPSETGSHSTDSTVSTGHRNKEKLSGNPRMAQMYRTWDRMSEDKQADYLASSRKVLAKL